MIRSFAVVLLALALAAPSRAEDPAKALKSRDYAERLAAVEELRAKGGEDAEELLLDALGDRDWEVIEHAAAALAERGGEESVQPLQKLAVTGPTRRIRLTAVRSLGRLAPVETPETLSRMLGNAKVAQAAAEALSRLAREFPAARTDELRKGILRALMGKEIAVRREAARGIAAFEGGERRGLIERVLDMPEASVKAALLDAIRESPDPDDVPWLVSFLDEEELPDVLARRTIGALVSIVASRPRGDERDRAGRRSLSGLDVAGSPAAAARFVRLAGLLAERPPPPPAVEGEEPEPPAPVLEPEKVDGALDAGLAHEAPEVRAAAVKALERIATEEALDLAVGMAATDESPRVRLHALRALARTRGAAAPVVRELLSSRLTEDPDERVREYAAVALGEWGLASAVPSLRKALAKKDEKWEVRVCAAVSLGKTGDPRAVKPLRALLSDRDWKIAGAALVGLARVRKKEAVPDVIRALAADDTALKRTAWETLKRWAMAEREPTVSAWTQWWDSVKDDYEFVDLAERARQLKKYGYADTYQGVYEDLDVIVLQSRGDTIEELLDHLGIVHRLTRSAQLEDAGLHPYAVFVVNCTGEIVPDDVERLGWFVRVGGYVFGSCWALHETIEKVYPGVVRKVPIPGQVLANVIAEECAPDSPYVKGVFPDEAVRPIYVLYGSHLIEVLDPERVEVLIDSPETADTWPDGNLAAWFDAGHGVILDSANHFDLQGLGRAEGLKGGDEIKAYAMDHLGIGYEEARRLDERRIWGSRSKAAREARDLSAFRFITNFVRHKRRSER